MPKLPLLEARTAILGEVDAIIIPVFQDLREKAIPPKVTSPFFEGNSRNELEIVEKFFKSDIFSAQVGSVQGLRWATKNKNVLNHVIFAGLGPISELSEEKIRKVGAQVWAKLVSEKSRSVVIHVDPFFDRSSLKSDLSHLRKIRAFTEGLVLSAYEFKKYKSVGSQDSKKGSDFSKRISFLTSEKSWVASLEWHLNQVSAMGEAVYLARDWSNEPSNYGTPTYFSNEARKLSRQYGLSCRILTEKEMVRERMSLVLGVGQGSVQPSQFVRLEYLPKKVKNPKTIVLVGKGVTFDSGGISIKPSLRMEDMKHDMAGAATVLGATILASCWQVPNRIITLIPFVENMPDGGAIQPGNVLTARSGKTVEVINTDAEGRLILADALDYAQDLKPHVIIDVATLTGAVSVALGKQCCAILGNDDELISALRDAGSLNGERIWPLPLYDEYGDDLKSDCADLKNSSNDALGGTIRGAIFLKQFIREKTRWAHLDIAAMAYDLGNLPYYPKKGASGAYVRTLAQFIADF